MRIGMCLFWCAVCGRQGDGAWRTRDFEVGHANPAILKAK
jgi:hypothetical protein